MWEEVLSVTAISTSAKEHVAEGTRPRDVFYVPEIDGLRAIAVGAVMLYHLNTMLMPGGFTGVDVFFVISGYVVSASLAREASQSLLTIFD